MKYQDFYFSILNSTSNKREAKSYLQRFFPTDSISAGSVTKLSADGTQQPSLINECHTSSKTSGVNLGTFYPLGRAVVESPLFTQYPFPRQLPTSTAGRQHVAIVKIRLPQNLLDETIAGIGNTLSQLRRLGLYSVIIADCCLEFIASDPNLKISNWRNFVTQQSDRIVAAIDTEGGRGARRVDDIIGIPPKPDSTSNEVRAQIVNPTLLRLPLQRGVLPVVSPIGYLQNSQKAIRVDVDEIILALARELAGIPETSQLDDNPMRLAERVRELQRQVSLDRIIILDPLGGIPSTKCPHGAHIFLNLEQDYQGVKNELLGIPDTPHSAAPSSRILPQLSKRADEINSKKGINKVHLKNLELLQSTLLFLPPTSSALITTAEQAANSGQDYRTSFNASKVGTRKLRNPLIHNLLTDRPAFSSSLPDRRGSRSFSPHSTNDANHGLRLTTFAKRGMPLTIIPSPQLGGWKFPGLNESKISLDDPRLDLPRLIHLIEDSFDRKLDVDHYLNRIKGHVAGIVVAGEYEGGAIFTWECPPGVKNDGSEASRKRMVPYLDKFAVLKKCQGAGGVADIVISAMVRKCFPDGVCWRSRSNNPVNKWYFERARGNWSLPHTNWTMFWTTENLSNNPQDFLDYERVCRTVQPSWLDNKRVSD
ncbi:MAG: Amino-acid acetyltransferase, mitochondrial [Trizodia sp. TS-e1964]|nr:MAG: Amino-acid acetyltransferase, mitochondrial [Trizodia sp. TS-e1964]